MRMSEAQPAMHRSPRRWLTMQRRANRYAVRLINVVIDVGDTVWADNVSNMPYTVTDNPEENAIATGHPGYELLPEGMDP